jgi:hypothetical protein
LFQLFESLTQLFLGVHDDGTVPGNGFLKGFSGDEKEADTVVARLDGDFVTAIKDDKRAVIGFQGRGGISPLDRFGGDGEGTGSIAKFASAAKDVSEGVA